PQTYKEYQAYFERMIADPLIGAHGVSRRVAAAVARPRTPWWFRLAGPALTFVFSQIIPPPVRDRLGFKSTLSSRLALAQTTILLRLFNRFAPRRLRLVPQYLDALDVLGALDAPDALLRCGDNDAPSASSASGRSAARQPADVGGDHRLDHDR